ncbi:hypothetical protein O181_051658 [Austropuccinia psidii MF-1]|uniref:Uncharacterized protein n=1 Tax=Austropuccinia psidii MF-1 TaxID=1389203 RepID=A0A9Q3HNK8_9BASI|nr:hypothetical protein [Austropuccinia psidii MF-1]
MKLPLRLTQRHNEPNDHDPVCTQSLGKFIQFSQQVGMMEILHQHQQSQKPEGSPKCDICDALVWTCFTGTRNINDPPFMSIPGALTFSTYVDWFNAQEK